MIEISEQSNSDGDETEFKQQVADRSASLYAAERHAYYCKIDRLFVAVFFVQWPIAIAMAFLLAPNTWAGAQSAVHIHVYMAVGLGGLITLFPAWMAWQRPGTVATRHVIGASAMIYTTVFTHLAGGVEEAHFHFFMMMAFIGLYFDWRVIVTATLTIVVDHLLRTAMFPLSVFGVIDSPWFQLFRHIVWVVLEGGVLIYAALIIDKIMRGTATELAISQLRESKISDMEENERLAVEREAKEQEAKRAIETMRELEERQRAEEKERTLAEVARANELEEKVNALLESVGHAAKGNLSTPITVKGNDAIGQVGMALEDLFATLSSNFEDINQRAAMLSEASQELNKTSVVLSKNSSDTADQVHLITASANQISAGVQSTASSTEQMNGAIRDVSQCATDAVSVGQKAVTLASEATVTMSQLSESSMGIGNVLKVITSIAEQTNLLALNATIEAARAGDAGKGFAVVANEVKELAKETAKATDEISVRISTIQNDASNAGSVIEQIATIIEQIGDFQNTVAVSVGEQTATTRELSNTIRITADESSAIEQHLKTIASKALHTKESAVAVDGSATVLSDIASQLSDLISVYQTQKRPA